MNPNKKLIIFTTCGGRFGNELISYGHLIGFIVENKYEFSLINMSFWSYAHLLEITSKNTLCIFPNQENNFKLINIVKDFTDSFPEKWSSRLRRKLLIPFLHSYGFFSSKSHSLIVPDKNLELEKLLRGRGKHKDILDLENPDDVRLLNQANVTILAGYGVRSWSLFEKHQSLIRDSLSIREEYSSKAKNFIQSLRRKYDFLIGVVIRQGDYRLWRNGQYFFDTSQYISWIRQAKEEFGASTAVGFVVASDEQQDLENFKNLNVHFATGIAVGKGHYIENMVELSQCDIIMAPSSSFAAWAAFLGNKPILLLREASQRISSKDLLRNHIFDMYHH